MSMVFIMSEVRHTGSVRGGYARKQGADIRFIYLFIEFIVWKQIMMKFGSLDFLLNSK